MTYPCQHVVKNAPKWKLGYAAYMNIINNGRADVEVAIDGEDEALVT
jgi:hypothetical protein